MSTRLRLLLLGLLLLMALTELTFTQAVRLSAQGPNLLANSDFSHDIDGWQGNLLQRDGQLQRGSALLRSDDGSRSYLRQRVDLPANSHWLRIELEQMTEQVVAGSEPWQQARINLLQYNQSGELIPNSSYLHTLLSGDHPWHSTSHNYHLHPEARQASLLITLNGATGTLGVRAPALIPLAESLLFAPLYYTTLMLWLAGGVAIVWWLLAHPPRLTRLTLLVAALASQYLLLGPIDQPNSLPRQGLALMGDLQESAISHLRGPSSAVQEGATDGSEVASPLPTSRPHPLASDKLGHVALFALLTLGCLWARGSFSLLQIAAVVSGYAVIAEQLQRYTLLRGPDLWDIVYNFIGIALAFVPLLLYRTLRRRPSGTQGE